MQEIPDCLNRRYKVLDELVKEINSASDADFNDDVSGVSCNDPGVRLMCDFWNILKENPDCNLTKAVRNRMELSQKNSMFQPRKVSCYMAAHNCSKKDDATKKPDSGGKPINQCCHKGPEAVKSKCCGSKSVTPNQDSNDNLPLSKVLCNLKEAASFDRKCQGMVNDLANAQKQLQDQIQHLEHREEEGIQLLKKADCMWSCMEDAYKKKIQESQERQQELIKQLKEAEANTNKWRKNKKDLEFQMENINMCHQEISEKLLQKQNDLKCMNRDITDYKKRIENNKKEIDAAKKSVGSKKHASDEKIKKIAGDILRKETMIREEKAHKEEKENEGNQYIREARADLLNLSKVLLQKKIENEDMKTEKETLIDELEILSQSYDQCKDRCQMKKKSMEDEITKIQNEITHYKSKCLRCHQCTDTIDIRKFCTDCPRCLEERECLYKDDHCSPDHTMDCVCMSVKQKFLDNVFENMYTVLERQIKTGPGKCVAETVLNCLKRSRNGKLDQETRQILQDFILTTVKKNLNLTIVGGAVKTRCELDSDTYKQLMLCLKQVKAARPPKADKQTAAKKPPCPRWGGESECNCPKGPKACICTKRAPPPPNEPGPCPPPDKEDKGEEKICPHKESAACGPDCAMHAVPSAVGTDVAAWRPDPCQAPTCMFKNMRAAQCVLGPEALNTMFDSRSFVTAVPYVPNLTLADDQISCKCGSSPCTCKDIRTHPRERIIEEVMGKYFEVKPIDKVCTENHYSFIDKNNRKISEDIYVCVHVNTPLKQVQQKHIGCITTQNYDNFYNDTFMTDGNKIINHQKCMSKYGCKEMIANNMSHSFDRNKYLKANSKILVKSFLERTTSMTTIPSSEILFSQDSKRIIDRISIDNISNNSIKPLIQLHYPIFRDNVCNIAQKLIEDVIDFGSKSKNKSSKEWISVQEFVNEILDKPRMKVHDNDSEKNEIEIRTESLETDKPIIDRNNTGTKNGDIDIIYKNRQYGHNSSKNTKQMKVDTRTQCDGEICILRNNLDGDESSSPRVKLQFVPNALTGKDPTQDLNLKKRSQSLSTEKLRVDNKLKTNLIKEQFEPLLITKTIQNENDFFDCNKKLVENNVSITSEPLEIDEQIIDLIENIRRHDPTSLVSLKKTKSGHLILGLNSVRDENVQNVKIKRSASGEMIIELDKSAVSYLIPGKCKTELYRDKTTKTKNIGMNIPNIFKPQCSKNEELCCDSGKNTLIPNFKKDTGICQSSRQRISKDILQKMYENNHRNIKIKFKHRCKNLFTVYGTLLQKSPENIAIYIKDANIINDDRVEFPLLLQKTESNTIHIESDVDITSFNGVAKRTASNGFLIYIKESKTRELGPFQQNTQKTHDVFKIKIKGLDNDITEPPAVIKRTPSGNFDVVLEKEYEKYFQHTIRHQTIDENKSFFDLTKNSSSVILDFEKDINDRSQSQKALLMKSNSGLLKIIVSDVKQKANDGNEKLNKTTTFGSMISAKALGELLRKLPSNANFKQNNLGNTSTKKTKSCSDSRLYETAKMRLHSSQSILEKSSTTMKKTPSGQYAVVLDKDLKKTFINNLLSYLDKTSKGVIPIKRTDSGEITISFDKNTGIGECGSLKITPSGNIYLILDESNIRQISNNVAINTSISNKSDISPYVSKIHHPEHKAIATNCNADPNDSLCDASKCVCKSLNTKGDSLGNSYIDTADEGHNFCGKIKCSGPRDKQSIKSNNKSPHIVIRPCESRSEPDKRNKFQESYYCEVQSVCPYHKDRYETVSNELLEISGLCNVEEKKIISKVKTYRQMKNDLPKKNVTYDWNSFDYLPHQLPPFLRNISYS